MDLGALSAGLLTGLREGVEAALIVSIICAYLARTGNLRRVSTVFAGVAAAIVLSVVLGMGLFLTVGSFQEPYEQLFEGAMMVLAAGVVTWMLFWMRRQAANVKGDLQAAVDRALDRGSARGLGILAFIAVIREGVETSIFLTGQAASADRGAPSVVIGALIGLGIAVVIGLGFYQGSRRLNLASFFRWTGIALVFIAAGLVAHAAHEFIEVGLIPFGNQTLFDLSGVLPHEAQSGNVIGQLLRAMFGYSATPEATTFVAWLGYLVVVLGLYLRPVPRLPVPPDKAAAAARG